MTTISPPRPDNQRAAPEYERPEIRDAEFEEPTTNARQGVTDQNVRVVLAVSTIVLALIFAILYLVFFA